MILLGSSGLHSSLKMEAISLWAQVLSIDGEGAMAAGEGLKALAMRLLKELSISTGPTTTSPEARQPASPPEQTAAATELAAVKSPSRDDGPSPRALARAARAEASRKSAEHWSAEPLALPPPEEEASLAKEGQGKKKEEEGQQAGRAQTVGFTAAPGSALGVAFGPNPAWDKATAASGRFSTVVASWTDSVRAALVGASRVSEGDLVVAVVGVATGRLGLVVTALTVDGCCEQGGVTAAGLDHAALQRYILAETVRPLNITFCPPSFLEQIAEGHFDATPPSTRASPEAAATVEPRSPGGGGSPASARGWTSGDEESERDVLTAAPSHLAALSPSLASQSSRPSVSPRRQPRVSPQRGSPPERGAAAAWRSPRAKSPARSPRVTARGQRRSVHSRLADSRSFTGTHREGMVDMYRTASGNPAGAHGLAPTLRKEPRTGPETLDLRSPSLSAGPVRATGVRRPARGGAAAPRARRKKLQGPERISAGPQQLAPPPVPAGIAPEVVERVGHASKVRSASRLACWPLTLGHSLVLSRA